MRRDFRAAQWTKGAEATAPAVGHGEVPGMDAALAAAADALRAGDPLRALPRVALRSDAPALALRGIALAQLGDLARARRLLRAAARAFGADAPVARARCVVAEAEVALAARDLARWPEVEVVAAARVLARAGDEANAVHARLLGVRWHLLTGRVGAAWGALSALDLAAAGSADVAVAGLAALELALRRGRAIAAREALARARTAAARAGIPALRAEVERAGASLDVPVARLAGRAGARPLSLAEVEGVRASAALVVDGCRRTISTRGTTVDLSTRPVLFALARALAEASPGEVARAALLRRAFGMSTPSPSLRGRLRVDVGRLRRALRGLGVISATAAGFALAPVGPGSVAVLEPPVEGEGGALLGLLADGEPWSTSALAVAVGASARTVQRSLAGLAAAGRVQPVGLGRGRRWLRPVPEGLTLPPLLPAPGPGR